MEYGYIDELQGVISPELSPSYTPVESDAPLAATVFKEISAHVTNYNIKRVIIDPLPAIRFIAKDICMEYKEMARFMRNLKRLGCTVLMLSGSDNLSFGAPEYSTADGIILLDGPDVNMSNTLRVMKIRGSKHSFEKVPFRFGEHGIMVEIQ
jgi:KaiC/GvpD/RAD55 family RecA-like ATPase